jgi:hypothetical protein
MVVSGYERAKHVKPPLIGEFAEFFARLGAHDRVASNQFRDFTGQ